MEGKRRVLGGETAVVEVRWEEGYVVKKRCVKKEGRSAPWCDRALEGQG